MSSVFISYKSSDRSFVTHLAEDLRESGFEVWLDQWQISGRLPYWEEIQAAVEQCTHFVFVVSPDSILRDSGAMTELLHAIQYRPAKVIVPIICKATPFSSIPMIIGPGKLQIHDFTALPYDEGLRKVIRALHLDVPMPASETQKQLAPVPPPPQNVSVSEKTGVSRPSGRLMLAASLVIIVLVAGTATLLSTLLPKTSTATPTVVSPTSDSRAGQILTETFEAQTRIAQAASPTETASATPTSTVTLTETLIDPNDFVARTFAARTDQAAITIAAYTKTPTPTSTVTPNYQKSAEAIVAATDAQATANMIASYTKTPTATHTPTPNFQKTAKFIVAATDAKATVNVIASYTKIPTSTATFTFTPTYTPEPTICPPTTQATLLVEPIPHMTEQQSVLLTVNSSTGKAYEIVTVSSNAGQFPFQYGHPIMVPLVANSPSRFTITAYFPATNVNGCDYPAYQATAETDKNGAPLMITQQADGTLTETPTNNIIDLAGVPLFTNVDDQNVKAKLTDIFTRGKQNGVVKRDLSVIGDKTLAFAQAIVGSAANFETVAELLPISQFFAAGFPNIEQRLNTCNTNSLQYFDCAASINGGVAFIDLGNSYRLTGQPPEQFRADLENLLTQLEQRGIIPVLVSIPGPTNDAGVVQYNTVIAQMAQDHDVPLLNLYKLGADNPSMLNGDKLTAAPPELTAGNFSPTGVQFGENSANIAIMRMLKEIKEKVIDANP